MNSDNFLIGCIYRREYGERIKRAYTSKINTYNRKPKMYILKDQPDYIKKEIKVLIQVPIHYIDENTKETI